MSFKGQFKRFESLLAMRIRAYSQGEVKVALKWNGEKTSFTVVYEDAREVITPKPYRLSRVSNLSLETTSYFNSPFSLYCSYSEYQILDHITFMAYLHKHTHPFALLSHSLHI